jgi:hypothetical protein
MWTKWYAAKKRGTIKSDNFQLHPPRYQDDNVFRNEFGNLSYPLLFCAIRKDSGFESIHYDPEVLTTGQCSTP